MNSYFDEKTSYEVVNCNFDVKESLVRYKDVYEKYISIK